MKKFAAILTISLIASVFSCKSPSKATRQATAQAKNTDAATADGFRFIMYYDNDKAKQQLLNLAVQRGDKVFYQYTNFKAIAINVTSCKSKEEALSVYSKQKGVLQMVEDGVMELQQSL